MGSDVIVGEKSGQDAQIHLGELGTALAFSPKADFVAVGNPDKKVTIFELPSGRLRKTFAATFQEPPHGTVSIKSIKIPPDGKTFFAGSTDNSAIFWNV